MWNIYSLYLYGIYTVYTVGMPGIQFIPLNLFLTRTVVPFLSNLILLLFFNIDMHVLHIFCCILCTGT